MLQSLTGIAAACAGVSIAIGALALLGWALDVPAFKSILPGLPTMKANTAACFIFSGLSLQLWQFSNSAPGPKFAVPRVAAFICAVVVTAVAAVTVSQYLYQWNSGLDQLVFADADTPAAEFPGRMSVATAFNFTLIGVALLLSAGRQRTAAVVQGFSVIALIVAFIALFAYVYGADLERVDWFSSVALHTAIGFCVLSTGLLIARGKDGWMSVFVQNTSSASLGRYFLVGTLLLLPLLAELRFLGERYFSLYGTYFGIAILTAASMAALSALIWYTTRKGNVADRALANLNRLYATLSGINTLIVRVEGHEQLFNEACRIAVETGQFPRAWIAKIDPTGKQCQLASWSGVDEKMLSELRARLPHVFDTSEQDSMARKVISAKAAVVWNDIASVAGQSQVDVQQSEELVRMGIRSLILLPFKLSGEVVGMFALYAEYPGFFSALELRLLNEIAGDISFAIDIIKKKESLNFLAYYDPLTGLANRTLFIDRLSREIQVASRKKGRVIVTLGNLRRFQMINETFGRSAADELLKQVARRLQDNAKYPENLARPDGNYFASFLPSADHSTLSEVTINVLSGSLRQPFEIAGQNLTLEAAVGVAIFPDDGDNAEKLLSNAEAALQNARDHGEPCIFYEPAINARVAESFEMAGNMRRAYELGQFVLHYQPKVDFDRQAVESVEALIRWNSPELGLVPPGRFIPILEETGLIKNVGIWALKQAATDIGRWRAMGLRVPRCAVNVSAIQLRDKDFTSSVINALSGVEDSESMIDIEITESLIMEDVAHTRIALQALRGVGIEVAVDDFGTGYSSLAYLARLPINALKIDRAFVIGMENSIEGQAIVTAIISLAHSLRLTVIAEGVETEAQAEMLRGMECDLMQGYLFSKPVPFDALAGMLAKAA